MAWVSVSGSGVPSSKQIIADLKGLLGKAWPKVTGIITTTNNRQLESAVAQAASNERLKCKSIEVKWEGQDGHFNGRAYFDALTLMATYASFCLHYEPLDGRTPSGKPDNSKSFLKRICENPALNRSYKIIVEHRVRAEEEPAAKNIFDMDDEPAEHLGFPDSKGSVNTGNFDGEQELTTEMRKQKQQDFEDHIDELMKQHSIK